MTTIKKGIERKLNGSTNGVIYEIDTLINHLLNVPVRNKREVLNQYFMNTYGLSKREVKSLFSKTNYYLSKNYS